MPRKKPLIDDEGEVRELTAEDMARFEPAANILSPSLKKKLGARGQQKSRVKERITIRLSHDVVEPFRATGDGWQSRVNSALKDWLKTHKPAR